MLSMTIDKEMMVVFFTNGERLGGDISAFAMVLDAKKESGFRRPFEKWILDSPTR